MATSKSKAAAQPTMQPMKSAPAPRATSASSKRVRGRFLRRIGITRPASRAPRQASSVERSSRDLRGVPRRTERLRYRYDHRQEEEGERRKRPLGPGREARRVGFDENVTVVPIPMRHEYSSRMRTRLWSSSAEMRDVAERNFIEFAAEDRDWRNACEEGDMHLCRDTKELIHPVHIEIGHYTFGTGGSFQRAEAPAFPLSQICQELGKPHSRANYYLSRMA